MTIAPVRRSVHTRAAPDRAFQIFTARMGDWWPKGRTVGAQRHVELIVEPFVGGRWFERDADGVESRWGKVLAWEPPRRLILAWQLDAEKRFDPDLVTEVEITFAPAPDGGTDVGLEHRNLERFRREAVRWSARIAEGWTEMIAIFAAFADRPETSHKPTETDHA